ncbi:MAG: hypothetical protein MRJ65_05465 [Candidatus Brocadiaceae bacterium]|nr:hypothetical protein [Candidatus Brocadiaceae bacterium]
MPGRLIVIAGIDGSGKTIQTKLLCEQLQKDGYPVVSTDFPQYGKTFFADMIAKYLRGEFGSAGFVSPYLASLLYAGDRLECKDRLNAWLSEGNIIVSNRYVCDNMAHQGGKIGDTVERQKFFQWLDTLEYDVFAIPRPSLNIFLNVPVEIAYHLVEKKEPRTYLAGEKRDMHEEDRNHMRNAQQTFLEIAQRENNWVIIDCAGDDVLLSVQEIFGKIWGVVKNKLVEKYDESF